MYKNLIKIFVISLAVTAPSLASSPNAALASQRYPSVWTGRRFRQASQHVSSEANPAQANAAVAKITPAVVNIYGYQNNSQNNSQDAIVLPFFGGTITLTTNLPEQTKVDAGTGFFVNSNGYILTANHVVSDTNANYVAELSNGTQEDAQVLYRDATNDVAILKISGNNFPTVSLGDSSELTTGETVIGMGNALGQIHNLVSVGNLIPASSMGGSAYDADTGEALPQHLFQSSMQLYPGDSGGPTFDSSGNVVGINDAIAADQPNVSFSIPINYAKDAINKIVPQQT